MALGVSILLGNVVGGRWRIAPPVVMLGCGVLLGFVPAFAGVTLPSEVMLLIFLPALLYWESLTTSLRAIRNDLRSVLLVSTGLVILTAGAVAVVAQALGLPWGPAWVLGAALAPTDATVIGVLARGLPRRNATILRAESLINDGTALVLYGIAVAVTVGEEKLGAIDLSWRFLLSYGGGVAGGIVTAWLAVRVRKRIDGSLLPNVVSVLTPFVAFLLAEWVHASGVLAVVTGGLILSQYGPRVVGADARQQVEAFWNLATFLLNGALFVLVGLEAHDAIRGLGPESVLGAFGAILACTGVVVGARFLWFFTMPYLTRAIDRRPAQRLRRVGPRQRVVSSVAGFRGAVSMAAALAIPQALASGAPFPDRSLIVVIVSGVIVVTLVVQGLALPPLVRWAGLAGDDELAAERRMAETTAAERAFEALPEIAAGLGTDPAVVDRVRADYEARFALLRAKEADIDDDPMLRSEEEYSELRLGLLAHKRATVIELRDTRQIDDIVLRQVQSKLDIEEVRLTGREIDLG